MNRIYIYVMLFSGILFLNNMTCFAANEKLSASSRQTLDQLIRSDNRLEKLSRQDKDLRLLVQCDEHTTENDYWNVAFYRTCHWETDSIRYVFHRRNCLVF